MAGWYCLEYLLLNHWYNVDTLVGNAIQGEKRNLRGMETRRHRNLHQETARK